MSEAVAPRSVAIAAVPGQVGLARAFVAGVLGDSSCAAEPAAARAVTIKATGSTAPPFAWPNPDMLSRTAPNW